MGPTNPSRAHVCPLSASQVAQRKLTRSVEQHVYRVCARMCALAHMAYVHLEYAKNDWSRSLNQMAPGGDSLCIASPGMLGACVELTQWLGQEALEL